MALVDISFTSGQQSLSGELYQIHASSRQEVEKIYKNGQKDNLDQLYLQSGDKFYVLEGDNLNISALKQGLSPIQVNINGQIEGDIDILFADDAIHSATEGMAAVKSWAVGTVLGGLVGATGFTLSKIGHLQSSQLLISQGVTEVSQSVLASQAAKKIPINIIKGSPADILKPKTSRNPIMQMALTQANKNQSGIIIKNNMRDNPVIRQGIEKAKTVFKSSESGIAKTSQGIAKSPNLRSALYVAGAGLALAGVVVATGALYGATRSSESSIDNYKQKEIK